MATAVIQFRVKPSGGSYGAVQTGAATLVAEDEVQLQAASYSGWQSARWEIVEYPASYPAPAGWSTSAAGVYYYNANSISGLTPPPFTMPTSAQITAGRWGKWIARVVVTTSSGTITSDPRVAFKIVSPSLSLNGIGFSEEDEFDTQRAYVGELQEDLVALDAAALVSGGYVASATATRPIKVSGSTGAVTWSWEPNANVANLGYGFTGCPSIANATGALALSAGSGAATLTGSTTASVTASGGNLTLDASATVIIGGTSATKVEIGRNGQTLQLPDFAGTGTRILTVDDFGNVGETSSSGASATANYVTDSASTVNANDRPAQALPGTLEFIRAGGAAVGAQHTAAAGSAQTALYVRRGVTGGGGGNAGTGAQIDYTIPDGLGAATVAGRVRSEWVSVLGATVTSKMVWATVASGPTLTDWMTLSAAGGLRLHAYGAGVLHSDASGNLTSSAVTGSDIAAPLTITRDDASANTVLDVLTVARTTSDVGNGQVGLGSAVVLAGEDDAGTTATLVRLSGELTTATGGAHAGQLTIAVADGGSETDLLTVDTANGVVATTTSTVQFDSSGATDVAGFRLVNDTATTGGTTEQRPPHLYWKGHGRNTSGGGSDVPVEVRIRPVLTAAAGNPTVDVYFQRQLSSGGWLTYLYLSSSLPGFGGAGVYTQNTIFLASPSNGLRIDQGGSAYGGIKASSGNIVVESQGSGNRAEVWGAIATGTNGDGIRLWNTAGTRTNGNLVSVGDGGSYTQKWAVQYDGATITPRVVAAPSLPTSTAAAVTFNLSTSQHVDHVISENTTVTITGGSRGQQGTLVFIQDGTGRTITMPAASSTLKYDTTLSGLGVTAMVDTTASTITLLQYRITNGDIVLIYGRSVIAT